MLMSRSVTLAACWLVGLVVAPGCSTPTRFAQTALQPIAPNLPDAPDAAAAASCPASLADRLSVSEIDLDVDVRYKRATTDNFPVDERVSLAVLPDGSGYIAWLDNTTGNVRVTPLDAALLRRGPDVVVPGEDIGGLVAQPDGFALLTRRTDPGIAPLDLDQGGVVEKAAFLVRYRNGAEAFAVPLTGTASITRSAYPSARDCTAMFLYGRLAWNGTKYGAYFEVHGCAGDPHAPKYGDKLVYADDSGRYVKGGWDWNCSTNQGLRLGSERDIFTAICLSDSAPFSGLNLLVEGQPYRQLAADTSASGYSSGQFGSLAKLGDGSYAIGWLSRGTTSTTAPKMAYDIAMVRLRSDYTQLAAKTWLTETPTIGETNLHIAPYGPDRLLVVWETVTDLSCATTNCFGRRIGTIARLMDFSGNWLTTDTQLDAVPNTADDITVFPNGDLGWGFVPDEARSYANELQLDRNGVASVPSKRRVSVARLRYCG
jgi:hypothetical protein